MLVGSIKKLQLFLAHEVQSILPNKLGSLKRSVCSSLEETTPLDAHSSLPVGCAHEHSITAVLQRRQSLKRK